VLNSQRYLSFPFWKELDRNRAVCSKAHTRGQKERILIEIALPFFVYGDKDFEGFCSFFSPLSGLHSQFPGYPKYQHNLLSYTLYGPLVFSTLSLGTYCIGTS
jgi:hypothetical protein